MKRDLQTLYIKYDSGFKTLSKIALSQLILKIVYIKGDGVRIKQIQAELSSVLASNISREYIDGAINVLIRKKKLHMKNGRYFIHNEYKVELDEEVKQGKELLSRILEKYFYKAESDKNDIEDWFNDTVICFFEKFSLDWFHQITYHGKNGSNNVPNINEILSNALLNNDHILKADKDWLKGQFIKFIDSEDPDDNLLFWRYGISMFSSRLITARNYADGITIEMFRNGKFILDTNILMILDLEEHRLSKSLKSLEFAMVQLGIKPVYLYVTRDEYLRAMGWRRDETIRVFDNYDLNVLRSSDCPFILTALHRGCRNGDDVARMFDKLMDIPQVFNEKLPIDCCNYKELSEAVEFGQQDTELKSQINEIYKKRAHKDKRERPLIHDAGIISGTRLIKKEENCWIVTSDSVLKRYAIEYCIRDENEIAIGLEVVIGLMAVNDGGTNIDASNFAPLFKNLIKYSLIPESTAFEVRDLAFILKTNMRINELAEDKVVEVAKEVKRMRMEGEEDENIALYLRRFVEGDSVQMAKDIAEVQSREELTRKKQGEAEKQRDIAYNEIRSKRRGELRDEYDSQLRWNRVKMLLLPVLIGVIVFLVLHYGIAATSRKSQIIWGILSEIALGLIPLIPINKRLVKKHSEFVEGIDRKIENEISELKGKAT